MDKLTVVTAGSRPINTLAIQESLKSLREHFDVDWVYSMDESYVSPTDLLVKPDIIIGSPTDHFGIRQKNLGMYIAQNSWVYFLDDDNIIHPLFAATLKGLISSFPDKKAFLFNQQNKDGSIRVISDKIEFGHVDTASFVVHKSIIGDATWFRDQYIEDFNFINQVYQKHPDAFYFSNLPCVYFNYLRSNPNGKQATVIVLWSADKTYDWVKMCLPLYRKYLPNEELILVDQNNNSEELDFVKQFDPTEIISSPFKKHGEGMNLAVTWCQKNDREILVHLEPDCLMSGRFWYDSLVAAIKEGAWMAGNNYGMYHPHIHPCPSAWNVNQIRYTFRDNVRSSTEMLHYNFWDIFDYKRISENLKDADSNCLKFFYSYWDTGAKNWYHAHCNKKAVMVGNPDFTHYWGGSCKKPSDEAVIRFKELYG